VADLISIEAANGSHGSEEEREMNAPNEIAVWMGSGGYAYTAVEPDDDPVEALRVMLDSLGDTDTDPELWWNTHEADGFWLQMELNGDNYVGTEYYTADGRHVSREHTIPVDSVTLWVPTNDDDEED
jgi:hypothetical protein